DNEQQARSRFTDGDTLLFVGRINQNPLKNNRTFSTNGNNHSLPAFQKVAMISSQSEKVIASRGKLNYLPEANDSTPLNRAFFVRNIRTPKEFADFVLSIQNPIFLSMVERNGPSLTGCLPLVAVFHPVMLYRPTVESLAVVLINQPKDTAEMIYKFLCVNRTHPHFNLCIQTIHANTEESARLSLNTDFRHLVTVAKINPKFNRTKAQKSLAPSFTLHYSKNALEKSRASRRKLNLLKANSAPQCAFFVRSVRAPLKNNLSSDRLFSMVTRNGQPLAVDCSPLVAVFLPCYALPPVVGKLAVTLQNLLKDTAEMIYKFLCVNRTQSHFNLCVISLNSTTEEQARLSLSADYRFIAVVARINPQNNRTLAVRSPLSVNNHSLPKCEDVGSIESTTTQNGGNRSRYQCGFFIPQIPFSYVPEKLGALSLAEFVARSIRRNKAEFIRTNKASNHPFSVVVEPLSHLTTGYGNFFTNKLNGNPTMKINPKNNRTLAALPTLSVSATQGGANV
ncbi:host cell division inhibitor Icd-like protein, partial [Haemophilus quentini]|uniref:host cell division inhibitor Icd-like protein n=1 Tax=Haemophilus quentini TaxID=123834 RepID=UPI002117978B